MTEELYNKDSILQKLNEDAIRYRDTFTHKELANILELTNFLIDDMDMLTENCRDFFSLGHIYIMKQVEAKHKENMGIEVENEEYEGAIIFRDYNNHINLLYSGTITTIEQFQQRYDIWSDLQRNKLSPYLSKKSGVQNGKPFVFNTI